MSGFKSSSFKTLKCNDCGELVEKVDANATGVTCWKCVIKTVGGHHHSPELEDNGKNTNDSKSSKEE